MTSATSDIETTFLYRIDPLHIPDASLHPGDSSSLLPSGGGGFACREESKAELEVKQREEKSKALRQPLQDLEQMEREMLEVDDQVSMSSTEVEECVPERVTLRLSASRLDDHLRRGY